MPRPLSTCAVADRGRRMRRPYEGSFFVCRGRGICLAPSPHARLLIEGDACVAPTNVPSSYVGARLPRPPHARLPIEGEACVAPANVPSSRVGARSPLSPHPRLLI